MVKVCEKRKYRTKKDARIAAKIMKDTGKIYPNENLHPYYCGECLAWHNSKITHNEYAKKFNESKLQRIERLIKESKK